MSFSTPVANPTFVFPIKNCATKEYSEKEKQHDALTAQVQKLKIHTFFNRDKRVFVKVFEQKFPLLTIKSICAIIGIKVSTYYYKARRPYFQGYVHERKIDPMQFSLLKEDVKAYDLEVLDKHCKKALVRAFKEKYPLLTIRKISQVLRLV